jgi:hypothetical protein
MARSRVDGTGPERALSQCSGQRPSPLEWQGSDALLARHWRPDCVTLLTLMQVFSLDMASLQDWLHC